MGQSGPLLNVDDLTVRFAAGGRTVYAVNGVGFAIRRGERRGIAGESGSGKSVTCRALLGLLPSNAYPPTGTSRFADIDLLEPGLVDRVAVRGRRIGYVFQDSRSALDPYVPIGEQLIELAAVHGVAPATRRDVAIDWLDRVGIDDGRSRLGSYPHEFSGGMCQRIGIAMALLPGPELLIADEPTSDVDVTTQRRLIELIERLCEEESLSLVLVSHDLGVIGRLCDTVSVLYGGLVVEQGPCSAVLSEPVHPYTAGLIASVPRVSSNGGARVRGIPGSQPTIVAPPSGCPFAPRCELREPECDEGVPPLVDHRPDGSVRCPVATRRRAPSVDGANR